MNSLPEFFRMFATAEACLKYLEAVRWRDGPYCPHCGSDERIYRYRDGRRHRCRECRRVFRIVTGTIFADSPISMLPKWFAAIRLETGRAGGISSVQLAKEIGVTQKTAWRMLRRIRSAAGPDDSEIAGGAAAADGSGIAAPRGRRRVGRRTGAAPVRRTKSGRVAAGISAPGPAAAAAALGALAPQVAAAMRLCRDCGWVRRILAGAAAGPGAEAFSCSSRAPHLAGAGLPAWPGFGAALA